MNSAATEGPVSLPYSGGRVDRASRGRSDDGWVAALLDDGANARLIPVWRDQCLVSGDPPVPVMSGDPGRNAILREVSTPVFLGLAGTTGIFAVDLSSLSEARAVEAAGAEQVLDVRRLAGRIPAADAALLGYARGLLYWHRHQAYCDSKLANLLFILELQRRLTAAGSGVRAVAAHPGIATTNLTSHLHGIGSTLGRAFKHLFNDAEHGALPTLYAATQDVPGACYVGPDGPGHLRGYPEIGTPSKRAQDTDLARRLWDLSARLTQPA